MNPTSLNFLNLFVESPGDLLYFFVVIALSQASLMMAWGQRGRFPQLRTSNRYVIATAGVVMLWGILLIGAAYTLATQQDTRTILPPLERMVSVLTIAFIGWAILTADHLRFSRQFDVGLLAIIAIAFVGFLATTVQWADLVVTTEFNFSIYSVIWGFLPAVLAIFGIIVLVLRFAHILDAPLKLVFFFIVLLGYGFAIFQMAQGQLIGDFVGVSRLATVISLVILPMVLYRLTIGQLQDSVLQIQSASLSSARSERVATSEIKAVEKSSTAREHDTQLLKALGLIIESTTPEQIPSNIVTATIDVLRADVGALLRFQDANYADVIYAFDRVMGRPIHGMSLNLDDQPTLVNAYERASQRVLYPERNTDELDDLLNRFEIDQSGAIYFQPLVRDKEIVAVLMVGMPYSQQELGNTKLELLKSVGILSSKLLHLSIIAQDTKQQAEEQAIQDIVERVATQGNSIADVLSDSGRIALETAQKQIAELKQQVTHLKVQLDDERTRLTNQLDESGESLSSSQKLKLLSEEQEKLRQQRDELAQQLQEAVTALNSALASDGESFVNQMVESLQREKETLETERVRLQSQLDNFRAQDRLVLPKDVQRLLQSMSQEKSQLEQERNQLHDLLGDIQSQLRALGVEEGTQGLTQLLRQIHTEQERLKRKISSLQTERDTLLTERQQFADKRSTQQLTDSQIEELKRTVRHLANDREVYLKQREKWREYRDDLMSKLDTVKDHRTRLLAKVAEYEAELEESHEEQGNLRAEIQQLANDNSNLKVMQNHLIALQKTIEAERDQLLAQQSPASREKLAELSDSGIHSLKAMVDQLSQERQQLEQSLNDAQSRLKNTEQELERVRLTTPDALPTQTYQPQNPEILMSLVQELRTPMTSIIGYVDLLLGESAGILGEMQRNFLQRVSSNISRLTTMIDDLVHVSQLDSGQFTLERTPVDVIYILEDAITNASNQFREKGLTVNFRLDDDLPELTADKDAIHQIVGQLLTNAYLVSPVDSEISITAQRQQINLQENGASQAPVDCLKISVSDKGGGIQSEDIPRVFARKYKAENPLIAGLGDVGVGMSIAKALVEAHSGSLWVETESGVGSTFNVALPYEPMLGE